MLQKINGMLLIIHGIYKNDKIKNIIDNTRKSTASPLLSMHHKTNILTIFKIA